MISHILVLSIKKVVALYCTSESIRFIVPALLTYNIFHILSMGNYTRYSFRPIEKALCCAETPFILKGKNIGCNVSVITNSLKI